MLNLLLEGWACARDGNSSGIAKTLPHLSQQGEKITWASAAPVKEFSVCIAQNLMVFRRLQGHFQLMSTPSNLYLPGIFEDCIIMNNALLSLELIMSLKILEGNLSPRAPIDTSTLNCGCDVCRTLNFSCPGATWKSQFPGDALGWDSLY